MRKILIFGTSGTGKTNQSQLLARELPRVLVLDPHREYTHLFAEVSSLGDLADYVREANGRWQIAYHNDHLNEDFPVLCRAIYEMRDCTLVAEEIDWHCDPYHMPPELEVIVKYGRHRHVGLVGISRRPGEVHRLLTSQSWELFCFAIQEPRDFVYLRQYIGDTFAAGINSLPPHRCRWQNMWDRSETWQELTPPRA